MRISSSCYKEAKGKKEERKRRRSRRKRTEKAPWRRNHRLFLVLMRMCEWGGFVIIKLE